MKVALLLEKHSMWQASDKAAMTERVAPAFHLFVGLEVQASQGPAQQAAARAATAQGTCHLAKDHHGSQGSSVAAAAGGSST